MIFTRARLIWTRHVIRLGNILDYNPWNLFAYARLAQTRHLTEYSPAKTGEYPRIFPNFQNCAHCEKDLKDNKDNSRHLGRKYARIFVHCLFLVAHIFPRASLSENCSLLGTDNVRGQISEHIFAPNGDYCLFIIRQIFSLARDWSKGVTWPNIPQLKLGNIREYSPIFKTARVAKEIWKIIKTIVAIMGENMLGCLSLDIISSS